MKRIFSFFSPHVLFILLIVVTTFAVFWPVFLKGQIPSSANLLASFFNPFAQEKFSGWSQGIPNKPTGIDDLRIFYPQKHFTIQTIVSGQIPFWNPYNYSGNYHAGLSETGVFYPLFLLFYIIPQLSAWVVLIIIEPVIAGIGMYLYLKLLIKDTKIASFGAIVFAFCGILIVRAVEGLSVGHTLIWFPFALFGIEAFFVRRRVRYLLFTLCALCFSILSGWFQFAFYIFGFSFIYTLFKFLFEKNFTKKHLVFFPFLLTPLFTLFHIIPSVEALIASPRGTQSIIQILDLHLMPITHIFTFLFPDIWGNPGTYTFFGKSEYKESILYIGAIPFIVSLFSIQSIKNKTILFFWIAGILSLFLGLDTAFTKNLLSLQIPIVSTFLPNRIFLITTFSFTVLSAYGLEILCNKVSKKIFLIPLVVTTIFVACVNGYIFVMNGFSFLQKYQIFNSLKNGLAVFRNLNFSTHPNDLVTLSKIVIVPDFLIVLFLICLGVYFFIRNKMFLLISVFLLTFTGQIYFAQRYIPFSNPEFMYPKNDAFSYLQTHAGINRFISTQEGYISSEIPLFYNLYSPDGVGSMYISRYGELVKYMQTNGQSFTDIPRIETRIDPSQDIVFNNPNPYLLKFMKIDGIRYVVTTKPNSIRTSNTFSLVWQNNALQIYKFNNSLPRFFLTSSFIVEKNKTEELRKIFDTKLDPRTIVLEENPGVQSSENTIGSVSLLKYTPNTIQFKINSENDSLLFLSDTFSSNFKAYVDNNPAKILRADYTFRAIVIPKGNHIITMKYQDPKEIGAFFVSGISILILVCCIFVFSKKKKISL